MSGPRAGKWDVAADGHGNLGVTNVLWNQETVRVVQPCSSTKPLSGTLESGEFHACKLYLRIFLRTQSEYP